ncbi:MAG: SusC/RagA family TonB-linked outer membrane protein [Runella sp.]
MNKNLLAVYCLFLCLLGGYVASAQERTLTGTVTSSEDGLPLPGVSVVVKGTTRGANTDGEGKYKITVPANARIQFSFVGFTPQEINVGNRATIDVQLVSDAAQLSEVVVTGYGATLKKKETTGATSSVKGKEIENLPMQSFDRALQGRSAGVQILSSNGTPGGAVQVRIRGTGSISAGNEPLYIVDGVQLNNRNDGGGIVNTNPLAFLNPNDIESIDVLKDAATAAIYGAQAANGVVLVTTKKGKAGAKTKVNLNLYKGFVEPMPILDVLSSQEFFAVRREALQAARPTTSAAEIERLLRTQMGFSPDMSEADIAALPTYNWQQEAYRQGIINNYEISTQGGNDKTTFYLSGAFNEQDASLINIDFRRMSTKLTLTHKINKKVTLESGINLSNIRQRGPYGGSEGTTAFGAAQYSAPILLPFNPIYTPEGGFYGMPGTGIALIGDINHNVIASSNLIRRTGITNTFVGNMGLTYAINKNLIFRTTTGLDYRILTTSFYGDPRLQDYFAVRGTLTEANNKNSNLTTNATLNYTKSFGEDKHNFGGLIGAEYRQEVNEATSYTAQGFPSPEFFTGNAAAEPSSIGGFWTSFRRAGTFANLRYDFKKKYLLNFIVRYDGSSRFGANNQWGWFPSVSAKWNIMEERFLKGASFISDLGLRASLGSTGNDQIGNFAARRLYGLGGVYQGASGIGPSQLGNPNLRWERNVTLNLGLDYGFFGGRLKGAIDAFERTSRDLLLTRSIPNVNGFGSIVENIGEVKNRGLEFELNTINFNQGGFKWETNFNITLQDNKVTKLFEGVDVLPGNNSVRVGYSLFTNVATPYVGVNPANGRPMWLDINDNITYLPRTADLRPMGHDGFTNTFGGFTNNFSYKGFEFGIFFQYDYGRVLPNFQEFRLADNGAVLRNSLKYYYENRWTTPGQITNVPRPAENRTEISGRIASYQTTSRFYQDASFLRLKTLSLAYSVPSAVVRRLKMSSIRAYAQGVNVLTWTKWTGFDPEFVASSNEGLIPQARQFTIGLEIGL